MKKHGTVKITRKMLDELEPCSTVEAFYPFLPATLSTDPLDNLELADGLARLDSLNGLDWLANHRVLVPDVGDDCYCCHTAPCEFITELNRIGDERDPYVIAQYLAAIADATLTMRGK